MTDLLGKIRKANDDYHEAIDEILENDIDVEIKVVIGGIARSIFAKMKLVDKIVEEAYE